MSDTPRTNKLHVKQGLTHAEYRVHSQRLERENIKLEEENEKLLRLLRGMGWDN
jgi:hypothetical protein